ASTEQSGSFTRIPQADELEIDPTAAYAHITTNNTIFGTQFHYVPNVGSVPLVADMSSDFLWAPFDVSRFAFIYAGAQKNIGPSGLVVVLVEKNLLAAARTDVPNILSYRVHAENNSLYNTINTFAVYVMREVLLHMKETGGLAAMEKHNRQKGDLLYGAIDEDSDFFRCPVERDSRSFMNVVFRLPSEELEQRFVGEATAAGLAGLKGHRSVGGIRASIYNAVPLESVNALVDFMRAFRKRS
ncbi:MAG TPA: 3-phosphoserine/phosphohydroxythreonine transaminase, partial [Polyangiaceae bacterium]|nr:3-phosphoserine/phosphohydroxythreonine transaminase [Polyangiaceae bacterium]